MRQLIWEAAIVVVLLVAIGGLALHNLAVAGSDGVDRPAAVTERAVAKQAVDVTSDAPFAPEIDPAEFDRLTAAGVAVVDFTAAWCPACRALEPTVDRLAGVYRDRAFIGKLDIDADGGRSVAARFGVRGIPTLIFLREGREVDRTVGVLGEAALSAKIDRLLGEE